MTHDDIIKMAREAGFDLPTDGDSYDYPMKFERFAALVAAAEREACARMIEGAPPLMPFAQNDQGGCMVCGFTPKVAAAAIRERGKA